MSSTITERTPKRTVILIPWRPSPDRLPLFEFVQAKLAPLPYPIRLADSPTEIFSIAQAFNAAADCEWDYAILTEADVWVGHDQILAGLYLADAYPLVYCYDSHLHLTDTETTRLLANPDSPLPTRPPTPAASRLGSNGVRVIRRDLWDRVGGYDPRFVGWGAEDNDFINRVRQHAEIARAEGIMYELAHDRDPAYFAARAQNRELLKWKEEM